MPNDHAEPIEFDPYRFDALVAPWGERPSGSRGRLLPSIGDGRTPHQRDRDRIIHATAFRRLKHKTQVFIAHEGDHFRTRLTHSLEVAQIARSIARALRLNEDLAEAIALAHDLGHPPFGHAGEDALDTKMAPFGGFDHNIQSLRVVTELERRYLAHDGLNLTVETLEGLAKHGGATMQPHPVIEALGLPEALSPAHHGSLEAQVAALADDIAYNAHDIDDGLRAGLFRFEELRTIEPMADLIADLSNDEPRAVYELMRRQITMMIRDVISVSVANIIEYAPQTPDDVRKAPAPFVAFSSEVQEYDRVVRAFLLKRVYTSAPVANAMDNAAQTISDLFNHLAADPSTMGPEWRARCDRGDEARTMRTVADYIAGMTDTYALARYARLTGNETTK